MHPIWKKRFLKKLFKRGFTLIELLIVLAIVSFLTSVFFPAIMEARAKGEDARRISATKNLQTEIANQTNVGALGYATVFTDPASGVKQKLDKLANDTGLVIRTDFATNSSQTLANTNADAYADATSYVLIVPMKTDPTKFWCTDSAGASKQVVGRLNAAVTGPKDCDDVLVGQALIAMQLSNLQSEIGTQADYSTVLSAGSTGSTLSTIISNLGLAPGTYDAYADASSYVVVVPIPNSSAFWCIDSDGNALQVSGRLNTSIPGPKDCDDATVLPFTVLGTIEGISVNHPSLGLIANNESSNPQISSNGQYIVFTSSASNLVANDTNNAYDIFVFNTNTNTISRASISSGGIQGADNSLSAASISSDGRFVSFTSSASNLVANDTNGQDDVFVRDMIAGTTERVSLSSLSVEANSGSQPYSSISGDGRYVAFVSDASNLVPNDTNGAPDVFVYDRTTDTIERVSVSNGGVEGNSDSVSPEITPNGQFVAFVSYASNLVPLDTNGASDVFVYDRTADTVDRASVSSGGVEGDDASASHPSISADGNLVIFNSAASNLVPGDTNAEEDIFIHDRITGSMTRIMPFTNDEPNGSSEIASRAITNSKQFIVFHSYASNLVPNDTNGTPDVFIYDRINNSVSRISVDNSGTEGDSGSYFASIADNGYVAFHSYASNLAPVDSGFLDIFLFKKNP